MSLIMLSDPISFLLVYYFFNVLSEGIVGIIKISVISSVMAFPFAYLGSWLYGRINGTRFTNIVLVSLVTSALFWAVSRIIAMATTGSSFIASELSSILAIILAITLGAIAFTYLGLYFSSKMRHWTMPKPLNLYLSALLSITVFWIALTALLRVVNHVIQ